MLLFSRVRGLPVLTPGGAARLGLVRALTVDAASRRVTYVRMSRGRLRREATVAWDALCAAGPDALVARAAGGPDEIPAAHHELLGSRVLTECGEDRGTVLDGAFDPVSARIEAILTTYGELSPDRLLGLGDYALVVRTGEAHHLARAPAPGAGAGAGGGPSAPRPRRAR